MYNSSKDLKNRSDLMKGYLRAESFGEFVEIDDAIVVFVQLSQQVHAVVLKGWVVACLLFDLSQNVLDVLLREKFRVVLHVLFGVLVGCN